MGKSREALPAFERGQPLSAAALNQIVNAVVNQISGGDGIKTSRFGNQIIIESIAGARARQFLTQMVVLTDEGDYITCRRLDANDVPGPGIFNVLKPWTLRRSPFEGLTVNGVAYTYSGNGARTADGTESQVITQDYFAGSVIYAFKTEISFEVETGVFSRFIDMNLDGRDWGEPE